jgi:excisionase family DNA binding protein
MGFPLILTQGREIQAEMEDIQMDAMRVLTAKEAADYLRISLFTLRKIEQQSLIVPYRTPGGHRRYSLEMLNEYLEKSRIPPDAR